MPSRAPSAERLRPSTGAFLTDETRLVQVIRTSPGGVIRVEDCATEERFDLTPRSLASWRVVRPKDG